jgi:hypothetical protein
MPNSQNLAQMSPQDSFREYCLQYYKELRHPLSAAVESIDPGDLNAGIELFQNVLETGPSSAQYRGLEVQFYSAFTSYATGSRTGIGALCNAIDRLAGLIEPFLKKIAFHFLGERTVSKDTPKGKIEIPLSKSANYGDIIEALGIVTVQDLSKRQDIFWQQQSPRLAILRQGFSSRHKGAHESRIHSLEEVEKAAYSVIGQYLVICLSLLQNPSVTQQVHAFTERARVAYLLRERARMYPLARALLSRREHLLLYRHREHIHPDLSEKRFLFLNYMARRGPCFYWLRGSGGEATAWARELSEAGLDEQVKKNVLRYLLEHRQRIPLLSLLRFFGEYSDKVELARHMAQCATSKDKGLLLSLTTDRREEVALEAKRLVSEFRFPLNSQIKKLVRSASDSRIRTLRLIIPSCAKTALHARYRSFPQLEDPLHRIYYAYCLGEVGDEADLRILRTTLSRKRLDRRLRIACSYATARIGCRLGHAEEVMALIRRRQKLVSFAALDAVTGDGFGCRLSALWTGKSRDPARAKRIAEAVLRIAAKEDRKEIRTMLSLSPLGNDTRDLLLALCKVGRVEDCSFVLRLLARAPERVELFNNVRIAEAVASMCRPGLGDEDQTDGGTEMRMKA